MSLRLETRNLSKSFGEFAAVSSVSLTFEPGLIHAVLGENGAGKSTLMKLLFALHRPSSGEIWLDGKRAEFANSADAIAAGLGMVQQHFSIVENLSVIDNVILGAEPTDIFGRLNRKRAIEQLEALLPSKNLRLDWFAPVEQLSVGEKQKIEILKLLFRRAKILFLDEPTAVLTPQEILDFFQVLRDLKNQGRSIVLITHKLGEVMQICDTYTVLRHGKLIDSGSVAHASVDSLVESMIGKKLGTFNMTLTEPGTEVALKAGFLKSNSADGRRGRLSGASFEVRSGEIVGIAGVEGSGQSDLVEMIFGGLGFSGDLEILGKKVSSSGARQARELGVGLVPEDRQHQGLWMTESCHLNMAIGLEERFLNWGLIDFTKLNQTTASWAKNFDVRASSLNVAAQHLSGGNQQKLIFARELVGRKPRLLICHQPTRGVDLGAIDLIHRQLIELRNRGLGILLMSSELDELLKLSDRIAVLYEGRISAEFFRRDFDPMKIGAAMTGTNHAH